MTSLPKGYVIPRLKAGHQSVVARDGQNRVTDAAAGCDSRQQVMSESVNSFYRARCKHCKNFHDANSYCFRLKIFSSKMPRSKSRSRSRSQARSVSRSSSDGSVSGSGHESDSGESALLDEGEVLISDKHGPPVDLCKLDKFYNSRKRIDAPEEKLVLQAPTVQMYFRELLGHGKLEVKAEVLHG